MSLSLLDKFHIWRRKRRWNKQYKSGKWDYLNNDIEAHRYKKIVEFAENYGPKNPRVLDLGTGEGILMDYFKNKYSFFLGIDYSSVSINNAKEKNFTNSYFQVADLHHYEPEDHFDIIIFNEAFYYIKDSERAAVLSRVLRHLNPDGILICSIYRKGMGCWEYFEIKPLKKLDFETVTTPKQDTFWKVGVYKKIS